MGRRESLGKSSPKHSLPEDLLREILSLLPVKSLLRFRSVSKSWQTLISDPDFVRYHLARFSNNRHESHLLAVQYDPHQFRECALRRYSDFHITARLGSFGPEEVDTIVGSIDGLFMLKQRFQSAAGALYYRFVLWNPSLRKILIVNSSPFLREAQEFGLGFDPFVKDYKYVRFDRDSTEIYTATKSWRRIQQRSLVNFEFYLQGQLGRAVCFMGHLFAPARYTVTEKIPKLLLFDFRTETYATMDWPGDTALNDGSGADGLALADGGRTLQLISLSSQKGSVWALEGDLGRDVKSWSWVQRHTFVLTIGIGTGFFGWGNRFLHIDQNGMMLLRSHTKVIYLNLETKEEKQMWKNLLDIWPYRESLLILNYAGVENVCLNL